MDLGEYLFELQHMELELAQKLVKVAKNPAVASTSQAFFWYMGIQCRNRAAGIKILSENHLDGSGGVPPDAGPRRLPHPGDGADRLLVLQGPYVGACVVDLSWNTLLEIGAQTENRGLVRQGERCSAETGTQLAWIRQHIKQATTADLLPNRLTLGSIRSA